jgi:protein associated with RNAse G/E
VKKELFMNLLECMDFQLDLKSEQALQIDNYACKGNKINYQEVLDNIVLKRNGPSLGTWYIKQIDSVS